MTESTRLFRAAFVAGTLITGTLTLHPALHAQTAAPKPLPVPRYQSPGVPQVQAPTPQYQLPQTVAITPNATVVEDVIVRVNDGIISRSDLERAQQQMQGEGAGNPNAGTDPVERQRNLLRDLIDQQLLLSKGKELNIIPDAEVVRRLDEIRKQNNFATMEDLEKAARSQGVSFEDFRASIRNSIITGNVVRDEVGRTIRLSRGDEQKYYDAHKDEFTQPEQVRLSEILVPTAANADDTIIAAAQKSATDIYAKLKSGADFAATAKASSGGPTAAQGGDLGLFVRGNGKLAAVLEEKTFALPAGGYTEPIRTRQGFVILRTTEHQQAGTPALAQVEGEVQNAMYQEAIQPALRTYLTRLREEAFIDLRPGFVDSGASAKQTKPVFAAYVPPAPKKQTQKQRLDAAKTGRLAQQTRGTAVATATPAVQELDKHGKPKKAKREKVRFGQAPRTALPEAIGTADAETPGQSTAGASTTDAPGQVISPVASSTNTVAANSAPEDDPLAPQAGPRAKTRFASREIEVKQKKVEVQQAKVAEKVRATPVAATTDEKQTKTVQADALGLNGSNAKKQKVKRKKGDPKERLQEKPVEAKAPLQDNGLPDRLHQIDAPQKPLDPAANAAAGTSTKPSSDTTTLAPAAAPAPGSPVPSQIPPSSGAVSPSSNQPVPQTPNQPR